MRPLKFLKLYFLPEPNFRSNPQQYEDVLGPIQERILIALLRVCFVFGALTLILGTYATLSAGLINQFYAAVISVLVALLLLRLSQISHYVRAKIIMLTAYFFMMATVFSGVTEITFVMFFSFVVMVTLLIGIRSGVFAILLSIVTMFGISWGLNQELLIFRIDTLENPFLGLFLTVLPWLFFVGIFILTAWVYFDGFNILLKREQEARVQMENERNLLASALEREKLLLNQLEASYSQVSELSKMKSQMITVVAHEFRTPLTSIKSSSQLLTAHLDRLTDEKRSRIQGRIDDSILSLDNLLQDIETVNMSGNSEIVVNTVETPVKVLQQHFETFIQNEFDSTSISIAWDGALDKEIHVDIQLVERILLQIISNAIKFSPEEGSISVLFDVTNQFVICIRDSGIGIDQEEIYKIWEPFYRAENAHGIRGLGLGLSLASLITDVLNGEITAVSDGLDQGAEFKISLPID